MLRQPAAPTAHPPPPYPAARPDTGTSAPLGCGSLDPMTGRVVCGDCGGLIPSYLSGGSCGGVLLDDDTPEWIKWLFRKQVELAAGTIGFWYDHPGIGAWLSVRARRTA